MIINEQLKAFRQRVKGRMPKPVMQVFSAGFKDGIFSYDPVLKILSVRKGTDPVILMKVTNEGFVKIANIPPEGSLE